MEKERTPVAQMLELSTGHLSSDTISFLYEQAAHSTPKVIVYEKGDYGFLVLVVQGRENLPPDLDLIMGVADDCNCSWIMLDGDGPILDSLPFYNW